MRALICLLVASVAAAGSAAEAQEVQRSERHDFRVVTLVRGLDHPWALAFLPDGAILVTERPGRLRLIRHGELDPRPIAGVPSVAALGQGGLLDLAPHPDFARNGMLYFTYAAAGEGGASTRVARARLDGHRLTDLQVLFDQQPKSSGGLHFGSRIRFLPDGTFIVVLGDRYQRDRAQDLGDHRGKSIRLTADGAVPPDNPFVGRDGARPEVYTLGNRNAQGLAIHPATGQPWQHEHGPQGGDEINILRPGRNYGWPVITFGEEYGGGKIGRGTAAPGFEPPRHVWVPSIAPSGMSFYSGSAFPGWRGNLFVGALRDRMLVRVELDGERVVREERLLRGALGRIREVKEGPDGLVYVLTDAADGVLARLEP
ncbi:MAG: PQQ-dependent sugar dehydrogenase [Alphaproteobacteria bacterium]|nr:PQQ-dependent sugar dehydrogenase [Alphaproteobacteria bacterium]